MRRLSFGVVILLSLLMINNIAEAQGTSKVLLFAHDWRFYFDIELTLVKEVGVMVDMLQKAGFKVVVASPFGTPIEGRVNKLKPDLKLSEVKADDYAGFILPCWALAPMRVMGGDRFQAPGGASALMLSIIKQAVAKGKPVAAADESVYILAEAGVLEGKRYAFPVDPARLSSGLADFSYAKAFGKSFYSGSGVVQDGNIITSGVCPQKEALRGVPDRTAELTRAFIEKLSQKNGK